MAENIKNKTISGFIWNLLERFGAQAVTFVVSIVLARMLDPELYGIVAIATIFTALLNIFVDSGFGSALIQKKDVGDLEYSTIFFFNVFISFLMYIILFLCAEPISWFYEMPELVLVLRISSISVIIYGIKNIQVAYISRQMDFKKFFFATLGGTIVAGILGISMALAGFGVWALVGQSLVNGFIDTIILWVTTKWRPKLLFSFNVLKRLFGYGWKLLAAQLVGGVYGKIRPLIIGKMYTATDLAYYEKGGIAGFAIDGIYTAIGAVAFPAMSSVQDDTDRIRNMARRSLMSSICVLAPLLAGLAVCAEPLVALLLTDKWLPCVPFIQVMSISYLAYAPSAVNLNVAKAVGRSDLILKLRIITIVVNCVILLTTMWVGVIAIAIGVALGEIIGYVINAIPNKKLIGYGVLSQIKDMGPNLILSVIMGLAIYPMLYLPIANCLILILQILVGMLIYIGGAKLTHNEAFEYLIDSIKPRVKLPFCSKKQ